MCVCLCMCESERETEREKILHGEDEAPCEALK
jgi:hypothetical protein